MSCLLAVRCVLTRLLSRLLVSCKTLVPFGQVVRLNVHACLQKLGFLC